MLGIRCVGVGASQRIPFSVLAPNPHKGLACEISYKTGRGRGKVGTREKREGDRTWLSIGGCEDPEARLANVRGRVSVPSDFVGISLEYTLAIAHRMQGKYHKLPPSCAWS